MVSAIAPDPVHAGNANLSDTRYRPLASERKLLADSTPPAPQDSRPGKERQFQDQRPSPEPDRDRSAMFAAAVIAGALPPTPTSMEELIMRIGASPIPAESEARLKDILA